MSSKKQKEIREKYFNDLEYHKELLDDIFELGLVEIALDVLTVRDSEIKKYFDKLSIEKLDEIRNRVRGLI